MNGFEIEKVPAGIEEYIASFKQAVAIRWNSDKKEYELDDDPAGLRKMRDGFEKFTQAVRDVCGFSQAVMRGTPKFCLAISQIYEGLRYVGGKVPEYGIHAKLGVPAPLTSDVDGSFKAIIVHLGLSDSVAYRYKDLAKFVDEESGEFYPEFRGYSLSLLSEIITYARKNYMTYLPDLRKLCKLIPLDTTVEDFRLYRKAIDELNCYGGGLFKGYSYDERKELRSKKLPAVIKVYQERLQEEEKKKLEATMSTVNNVAKSDKSNKILPAADEMIVKKFDWENLRTWAKRAENVGKCAGCKHEKTNLNKCRCCRRYESLKDLFEQ